MSAKLRTIEDARVDGLGKSSAEAAAIDTLRKAGYRIQVPLFGRGPLATFNKIMTVVTVLLCTVVWGVVGFLVWVPCLTRMMMIFVGAVMVSVFTNRDISKAERGLEQAIGLYSLGFHKTLNLLNTAGMPRDAGAGSGMSWDQAMKSLVEIVFAALFWILLVVGWSLWFGYGWGKVSAVTRPAVAATVQPTRDAAPPSGVIRPPATDAISREVHLAVCGERWRECKRTTPAVFEEWCKYGASVVLRQEAMCPGYLPIVKAVDERTQNLLAWCGKFPTDCRRTEPVAYAEWCKGQNFRFASGLTCP